MKKLFWVFGSKYRKLEKPKISCFLEKKHYFFLLFSVTARMKMKNYLKKKKELRYKKLLV